MKSLRCLAALALACASFAVPTGAQRRTTARRATKTTNARRTTTTRTTTTQHSTTRRAPASRRAPSQTNATAGAADARMTGVYRLDARSSADAREIARRVAQSLPPDEQQRVADDLSARLAPPPQLAIQRRGRTFDIASTRAPRISFEADGVTHTEQAPDGHTVRTRAAVYGDSLMVSSRGSADDEFSVNFDSVDQGRRLRVTRRIYEPELSQPVVVQSTYERVSQIARFDIYGEPAPSAVAETANNNPPPVWQPPQTQPDARTTPAQPRGRAQQQQPPVIRRSEPPPPYDTGFYVGDNARFVGTLDRDLSTETAREGDPFTLTVREPAGFAGARIEGRVSRVERGGVFSGRAGLTLSFERIVLPDGRNTEFRANVEDVRAPGDRDVRVDNEATGGVESNNNQSERTAQRAAIGAAVGAIIGAIASGGKGAAIGAAVGAGAGLGSVYAQGRDDLTLPRGTEIAVRTTRR